MVERYIGITVSSGKVTLVDADVDSTGPIIIQADLTWKLQGGDRSEAYNVIYGRMVDYITNSGVDGVVVKSSAVSRAGTKMAHLEAAELRGVVIAAASSVVDVNVVAKHRKSNVSCLM